MKSFSSHVLILRFWLSIIIRCLILFWIVMVITIHVINDWLRVFFWWAEEIHAKELHRAILIKVGKTFILASAIGHWGHNLFFKLPHGVTVCKVQSVVSLVHVLKLFFDISARAIVSLKFESFCGVTSISIIRVYWQWKNFVELLLSTKYLDSTYSQLASLSSINWDFISSNGFFALYCQPFTVFRSSWI